MKFRKGPITNSSSTSYVVGFKVKSDRDLPSDFEDVTNYEEIARAKYSSSSKKYYDNKPFDDLTPEELHDVYFDDVGSIANIQELLDKGNVVVYNYNVERGCEEKIEALLKLAGAEFIGLY